MVRLSQRATLMVVFLISAAFFFQPQAQAQTQPQEPVTQSRRTHHAPHNKKHRRRRVTRTRRRSHKHYEQAPPGVATSLPQKQQITHSAEENTSKYGVTSALPTFGRSPFSASAQVSTASVDNSDPHLGGTTLNALVVTPQLRFTANDDLSFVGTVPLMSYNPQGATSMTAVGRPQLGAFQSFSNDYFSWGLGLNVRLPLYNLSVGSSNSGGSPFIESLRVWEFAPGVEIAYTFPDGATHISEKVDLAYETQASFSTVMTNPATGLNQSADAFHYPFAMGAVFDISHDLGNLTLGMAYQSVNWLGSGQILSGGDVVQGVAALDVFRVEINAAYHFTDKTSANASLSRGLKVAYDPASLAAFNDPVLVSDFTAGLGISQKF